MTNNLFSTGYAWGDDDDVAVAATPVATPKPATRPREMVGNDNLFSEGVASVAGVAEIEGRRLERLLSQPIVARSATLIATAESTDIRGLQADPGARVAPVAGVASWEAGVGRLDARRPPPGADPREWAQTVRDAISLMRLWGRDLFGMGWSAEDAFGVEPNPAHRRLDRLGLVSLIGGGTIEAVDGGSATIRHGKDALTYRRRPTVGAVPIWAVRGGAISLPAAGQRPWEGAGEAPPALPRRPRPVNEPCGESERMSKNG